MNARYNEGQRVKLVLLIGSDGRPEPELQRYVNATGTVVRVYPMTRDEFPDLSKMFVYEDTYCYHVRLDGSGQVLAGVPEAALELVQR